MFVTALREAQATDIVTGERFKVDPKTLVRVRVIGPHKQYYLLAHGEQYLLINRMDVEDADAPESSAHGDSDVDAASKLPELAAPKPVPPMSTSYTRRLDAWYKDAVACMLPPMAIPKIARAGEMTMLSGKWRDGKSTFMTWVCAELSRGGNILGETVAPTSCHWISFEEAPALVIARFRDSNPDPSRVDYTDGLMISPERTVAEFKQLLRTTSAKVVVVDSLSRLYMRGGDIVAENDNASWVRVLDDLQRTVRETGVALVFLHHLSKAGDSRGGTAIPASMDSAITMRPVSRAPRARKLELRGRTIMDEVTVERATDENRFSLVEREDDDELGLVKRICELVATTEKPSGISIIETLGVQKQKGLAIVKDLVARGVLLRHGRGPATYLSAGPKFHEVMPG